MVRLRFAPSPTGFLHLGGLRTALFNHLYARKLKGKWILRIEDTDQARFVPGAVEALQKTLQWAKLDYDEGPDKPGNVGPYVQSERIEIYKYYAEKLIQQGKAYRDFRVQVVREINKGIPIPEDYIPPEEDEARSLTRDGRLHVIRLRASTGSVTHQDLVYGRIIFPSNPNRAGMPDPILLKSSGWPTYHLANVIDDHEMGITHVLRGEEWIPSIPKHLAIYNALGLIPPKFAHLPLLVNTDGSKLSKRSGDVRVQDYANKGFEPEALNNLLALTGYNHKAQETERNPDVLSMQQLIDNFDIDNVSHTPACVSIPKLLFLNSRHVAQKLQDRDTQLLTRVRSLLVQAYPEAVEMPDQRIAHIARLTQGTCDTIVDITDSALPLFRHPEYDTERAQPLSFTFGSSVTNFITLLKSHQGQLTEDCVSIMLKELAKLVAEQSLASSPVDKNKGGKKASNKRANVMAPLRYALTAREKGPTLAEIVAFLGKDTCIQRLERALDKVQS